MNILNIAQFFTDDVAACQMKLPNMEDILRQRQIL